MYDFLWGPKNTNGDECRLTRAGYDRIAKEARVTKRNAALIVERLIEKAFLDVESPADPLQRLGCEYRVYSYKSALERLFKSGREYVVKSGNGVLFVRPITVLGAPTSVDSTTLIAGAPTTVVVDPTTTMAADQQTTVPTSPSTTVAAATTHLDNKKDITARQTSSSFPLIHQTARKWGVLLDDAASRKIVRRCRDEDPAATEEEVATFLNIKILQLRNSPTTRNMIGVLLSAVPAYFAAPATELALYRQQRAEERAQELAVAQNCYGKPE